MLAALAHRKNGSLVDLPSRLDTALEAALTHQTFTDKINGRTTSRRSRPGGYFLPTAMDEITDFIMPGGWSATSSRPNSRNLSGCWSHTTYESTINGTSDKGTQILPR